jgi:ATP-dependent Lon protease
MSHIPSSGASAGVPLGQTSASHEIRRRCRQKANYYLQLVATTGAYYADRGTFNSITHADASIAIGNLGKARESITSITSETLNNIDETSAALQNANDNLGAAFRTAGTRSIVDLINICEGPRLVETLDARGHDIWTLLKLFFSPTSYRYLPWKRDNKFQAPGKRLAKDRVVDDFMLVEHAATLQCFDCASTSRAFHSRVHGIRVVFQLIENQRTLVVTGDCASPPWDTVESPLLRSIQTNLRSEDTTGHITEYSDLLTVKDCLVYNVSELTTQLQHAIASSETLRKQQLGTIGHDFMGADLYGRRRILITLLALSNKPDYLCLAQLLYDLLASDTSGGGVGITDQATLHGSLPWAARRMVRKAIALQNSYSDKGESRIPLEQRITLMKVPQWVKDKANQKLCEVRAKTDDTGAKARQYLEGLVRIPFGEIREEPCLRLLQDMKKATESTAITLNMPQLVGDSTPVQESFDSLQSELSKRISGEEQVLVGKLKRRTHDGLAQVAQDIGLKTIPPRSAGKDAVVQAITKAILEQQMRAQPLPEGVPGFPSEMAHAKRTLMQAQEAHQGVKEAAENVMTQLDTATHGHVQAKRALARVVGQWMTGEQNGYCFGFEGPPGVGKTSLAKRGLANCLKDADGVPRPFCFLALGGATNGSYLDGHSYTYVGSTWGRIVDCLMDAGCMNPIIYIDELDKVSRTEHGKEIIGILTHITDATQNESFNDKYFSGVPIDLSKVLFVFSYNDPSSIDRILLDRIHRIKFEPLSLGDKVAISQRFVMPDLKTEHRLGKVAEIPVKTIEHIATSYTYEAGMRRLSEHLRTCVGEINLRALEGKDTPDTIDIDVADELLCEVSKIKHPLLAREGTIGVVAGLWASTMGRGGMLPIEATWAFGATLLEPKVTGLPGDTMRESVSVAINLAWGALSIDERKRIEKERDISGQKAIHVHFPDGATPKDGPSAGVATYLSVTSLLTKRPAKTDWAVTGEVSLQGRTMEIGGIDMKITGGYESGCRHFVLPSRNKREVDRFRAHYADWNALNEIYIHLVGTAAEAADLVLYDPINE